MNWDDSCGASARRDPYESPADLREARRIRFSRGRSTSSRRRSIMGRYSRSLISMPCGDEKLMRHAHAALE
jgi:hypothetical protein